MRFMRLLHYDCTAGISGDMNLGAMIDLGVDPAVLEAELRKLGLPEGSFELSAARASRRGIGGTEVRVAMTPGSAHGEMHSHEDHGHEAHGHHDHHSWKSIRALIEASSLSSRVKTDALAVFECLAEAEGQVHGVPAEEVRFHEVGAVDSIVDLVGAAVCWELLGIDAVSATAVELGGGTVRCAHGVLSVPAPATALLARGMEVCLGGTDHEAATPTGLALLACKARQGLPVKGRVAACGTGIGHRDSPRLPNVLRAMILETDDASASGHAAAQVEAVLLACNIDDMSPERVAYLVEQLLKTGASDAWQEPIVMKKGRLAVKVCALGPPEREAALRACLFRHSSTLGVRVARLTKHERARHVETREAEGVAYHCKVAEGPDAREKIEFEDLRAAAERAGVSLDEMERRWTRRAK